MKISHCVRRLVLYTATVSIVLPGLLGTAIAEDIAAKACYVRVLDQANVSALERGALQTLDVKLGDVVQAGDVLATLDDRTAQLALEQAQLDLAVARTRHEESLAVSIAEAELNQSAGQLQQAIVEGEIADRIAATDLAERIAAKDAELSEDELNRITVARKAFGGSVSTQQLVELTIKHSQNQLKLDQARHERTLNELRSRSRDTLVEQHRAARDKLELELRQARSDRAVMELTLRSLATAVALAENGVQRRRLTAPLSGVVVERMRHIGEWVEPGDTVLRIIRLDRLQVEGYVEAGEAQRIAAGDTARITAAGPAGTRSAVGEITFISPEVDSVNSQVQVRAEFENAAQQFQPGEAVRMTITSGGSAADTN